MLKRYLILKADENDFENLNESNYGDAPSRNTKDYNISINFDYTNLGHGKSIPLKKLKKEIIDKFEKQIIYYVLENAEWNKTKTAKILNISYKALLYKIKNFNIKPPVKSPPKILEFPKIQDPIEILFRSQKDKFENNKISNFKTEFNDKESAFPL